MNKGNLYVVAAPSGAGKTSLVAGLVDAVDNIEVSVSHTSRPIRSTEVEGKDYYFVSKEKFETMTTEGSFLESAFVFNNYYGTCKYWVDEKLCRGVDVILEIDWQGAKQVRELLPETVSVFVVPPARRTLYDRLKSRNSDNDDVIDRRMKQAIDEMSHFVEFDYLIVNDDFNTAVNDFSAIVRSYRLKMSYQQTYRQVLLTDLLS